MDKPNHAPSMMFEVPPEAGKLVGMCMFDGTIFIATEYRVYRMDPATMILMPIKFISE